MYTPNGEKVTILMSKSKKKHNSKIMRQILAAAFALLKKTVNSLRFQILAVMMCFALIPLAVLYNAVNYYYLDELVQYQIANMQTRSAVIANEFTAYDSLQEAEIAGVYAYIQRYSALDFARIRVVDNNFVIESDSYGIENNKSIINSRVINAVVNGRSDSGYNRNTGAIESVVPIMGAENRIIGALAMNMDVSELEGFSAAVQKKVSTIMVAAAVVLAAAIIAFMEFFGKGFRKAFRTVEEIANGHTDKRIPVRGNVELREFAQDFNTIMDKISVLDESRQEFVSNVSHELKTPITSIKILADSLNMQEDVPVELYREFMQDITNEIDRESKLIEDLLSIVRMDKTAAAMNISSVNVNSLIEIILKRLKPIAQSKNIEILFESFRPVVAEIDEVKFAQVVSNLVENAVKYNKLDGWVHVSLNADYQYFYVRVEDSGIGIPKESQDMVFERFYRVDKARSRETGGTGLGLAIVRKIILMHHGTIKLHSEEDAGTTFTVRIPLNFVEE